ncbi:hypothetical protein SAV14893_088670 [Streptomyces avermitilis]|uniref:Uncharacterized protein n=1 Tax=Streptomyces avermitilis TaxID=33903 RepID=A0A4D4N974_STRAX|nr:hypothetical protein SAVMC3_07850 [Streptomyces avermitilis]GDY69474.1 hypothetical protein SAV14893_088670 [Streptomyces avermitilis]GDY79727.1 hypothetical protein SAV31267_092120 [Streptomyces avermitilis]
MLLDALEVREESAARMGDLCGAEFAQERDGLSGSGRGSRHGAESLRRSGSAPVRAFACGPDPGKARTGCRLGPALIVLDHVTPVNPMDF